MHFWYIFKCEKQWNILLCCTVWESVCINKPNYFHCISNSVLWDMDGRIYFSSGSFSLSEKNSSCKMTPLGVLSRWKTFLFTNAPLDGSHWLLTDQAKGIHTAKACGWRYLNTVCYCGVSPVFIWTYPDWSWSQDKAGDCVSHSVQLCARVTRFILWSDRAVQLSSGIRPGTTQQWDELLGHSIYQHTTGFRVNEKTHENILSCFNHYLFYRCLEFYSNEMFLIIFL